MKDDALQPAAGSREADRMEAGRELDALVRDTVFGPWPADKCGRCGWTLVADGMVGCTPERCSMIDPRPPRADEPPQFSSDIGSAWRLVGKLGLSVVQSEDGWYALKPHDIEHGCVRGTDHPTITLVANEGEYPEPFDTAPLAICRAALAAAPPEPASVKSSRGGSVEP